MNHYNMPVRAYEITLVGQRDLTGEKKRVFQGRTTSEAVMAAELEILDNPCLTEPTSTSNFKQAWNEYWDQTNCPPEFIIGKVRDLGIIVNQEAVV